jgi:hypothetical protein
MYDFSRQNDVAEYLREAQQEGRHAILRPGPYVCAEWELGGYPSWLLKDRRLVLRSSDAKYMAAMLRPGSMVTDDAEGRAAVAGTLISLGRIFPEGLFTGDLLDPQ